MNQITVSVPDSLVSAFDAVHGVIDLRDVEDSGHKDTIARLLTSPMLRRLHNIRQLGFVSNSFPAATHMRYRTRAGHAAHDAADRTPPPRTRPLSGAVDPGGGGGLPQSI